MGVRLEIKQNDVRPSASVGVEGHEVLTLPSGGHFPGRCLAAGCKQVSRKQCEADLEIPDHGGLSV